LQGVVIGTHKGTLLPDRGENRHTICIREWIAEALGRCGVDVESVAIRVSGTDRISGFRSSWIDLVGAGELASLQADIGDRKYRGSRQLALNGQIVILGVGSGQIGV